MRVEETSLPGVYSIFPDIKKDERGFFIEVYRHDLYKECGLDLRFVQTNHSRSVGPVLRGLHFQYDPPLGKLIRVINGRAFVVAVDIRPGSATLGQWLGRELNTDNIELLYVPPGFASGFCVLGEVAEVEYHYTALYNKAGEANIRFDDLDIGIQWPIKNPTVSLRDQNACLLNAWLERPEANIFRI